MIKMNRIMLKPLQRLKEANLMVNSRALERINYIHFLSENNIHFQYEIMDLRREIGNNLTHNNIINTLIEDNNNKEKLGEENK